MDVTANNSVVWAAFKRRNVIIAPGWNNFGWTWLNLSLKLTENSLDCLFFFKKQLRISSYCALAKFRVFGESGTRLDTNKGSYNTVSNKNYISPINTNECVSLKPCTCNFGKESPMTLESLPFTKDYFIKLPELISPKENGWQTLDTFSWHFYLYSNVFFFW